MKQLLLPLLLCFAFAVSAQTGDISGRIVDEQGLYIKAAHVAISDSAGVAKGKDVVADKGGNYFIQALPPGKYNLQFWAKGYASIKTEGILVWTDKTTFVNAKLKAAPAEPKKKNK